MNSSEALQRQVVEGLRVVRGPNWKWGNQDAGEGYVGTVVKLKSPKIGRLSALFSSLSIKGHQDIVKVVWDCGVANDYRIGHEDNFDLRIVDNATAGVVHPSVCMECCAGSSIGGIRWYCEDCDGSICSSCFYNDKHYYDEQKRAKHDPPHLRFKRYDSLNSTPVNIVIDPTKLDERVKLKGIFPSARVKRGRDWEKGDEDIADGVKGVGWVKEAKHLAPGLVNVKWQNNQFIDYRLGSDGKVDLQLVEMASGGYYNPDHLPVLKSQILSSVTNSDGEIRFAVGDEVEIFVDDDELKRKQNGHGGYVTKMKNFIGKPGLVGTLFADVGVLVRFPCGDFYLLNSEVLRRTTPFSNGQPVRIKDDDQTAVAIEKKYGLKAKKKLTGETGRIIFSQKESDWVDIVLDSDKDNDKITVHQNWVEVINGNPKVTKGMAKLKSKMLSVLVEAASTGQLNTIKELLTKYPLDLNAKDDSGKTALHSACRYGHLEIVQELYFMAKQKHLEIFEVEDQEGRRALHLAAEGGHPKILSFLIKPDDDPNTKGAELNAKDKKGLTALQVAVRVGCVGSVEVLIQSKSDINAQDRDGDSALHNAIIIETKYYRDPGIITALMSADGINFKQRNDRGWNPLLLSVAVKNVVTFDRLMTIGVDELASEEESEHRFNALHLACATGEYQIVRSFLKHMSRMFPEKAESFIEKPCKEGLTPLMLAVYSGNHASVELMVENGKSNLKAVDQDGDTAVHIAAARLEHLKEEPVFKTAPNIFKIHSELKKNYQTAIVSYPGLSLMCYLISKGCPWKKTRTRKIEMIIKNELIREVLEKYTVAEEPMDVDDANSSRNGCLFCSERFSVFLPVEECGHLTDAACNHCFQTRLHKCPTCRRDRSLNTQSSSSTFASSVQNPSFTPSDFDPRLNSAFQYNKSFHQEEPSEPVAGPSGYQNPRTPSNIPFQTDSSSNQYGSNIQQSYNGNNNFYSVPVSAENSNYFYGQPGVTNQPFNNYNQTYYSAQQPQQPFSYYSIAPGHNVYQPNWPATIPANQLVVTQENSQHWNQLNASNGNCPVESQNQHLLPASQTYDNNPQANPITSQVSEPGISPTLRFDTPLSEFLANELNSGQQSSDVNMVSNQIQFEPINQEFSCSTPGNNGSNSLPSADQVSGGSENGSASNNSDSTSPSPQYITVVRDETGSRRGGPVLKYGGHTFASPREGTKKVTWRCSGNTRTETRSKCSATIIEMNGKYQIGVADHTCNPRRVRRIEQQTESAPSSVPPTHVEP